MELELLPTTLSMFVVVKLVSSQQSGCVANLNDDIQKERLMF